MSDWYKHILNVYKDVKHFPENSKLITNPKNSTITLLNGKIDKQWLFVHVLGYGALFVVLSIMIIAAVINYEVIFRPKARDATKNYNEDVDYNKEFYSKSENANGLAFVVTVLVIMVFSAIIVFIIHWGYYKRGFPRTPRISPTNS